MTDQQKLDNYKNYVDAEVEMSRIPMPFDQFIESLTADDNCEQNGFYNTPAECEDWECKDCTLQDVDRRVIDCPYMD